MPDQLQKIVVISARRYNENRDTRPRLARALLDILNKATDIQLSTNDFGELLDYLNEQQGDPELAKAAALVLMAVGA